MDGQRVRAHDKETRLAGDERDQYVPIVLVHGDATYCSASVLSFTGIVDRVYDGTGRFVSAHMR